MVGQISLIEWLAQNADNIPESTVGINEVVNIQTRPICDYEITSTYRDIFIIINMLDDYVSILEQKENRSFYTNYMIEQFKRISFSLSEQIQLDKEKMYRRCSERLDSGNVGEDALAQIFG